MKSILSKTTYPILLVALCFLTQNGFSQKVQEESVWMSDLKVDGNTDDWNIPLKAHNKTTGIAYTMANDDENLYLMIQAEETKDNAKILLGGITLAVNSEGKKKTDDAPAITYPVTKTDMGDARQMLSFMRNQRSQDNADSVEMAWGNGILTSYKEIAVEGIPAVKESPISIYNLHGIKATAKFNEKGNYCYELAVPLELLGLAPDTGEFAYNLLLKGINDEEDNRGVGRRGRNNFDLLDMVSPTDFWGKYTLSTAE